MRLFYLRPSGETTTVTPPTEGEGTLHPPTPTEPQLFGFGGKRLAEAAEETLNMEVISNEYEQRVEEIFNVVSKKTSSADGRIGVEKVTVKLGVDTGGKIGWFVEGRLDVSLAFEVEFKFNQKNSGESDG